MSDYALLEPEERKGFFEPKFFPNVAGIQDIVGNRLTHHISMPSSILVALSFAEKLTPAPDQTFEANKNSFVKLKETLLQDKNFADKFVAIINGKMVDFNSDRSALVERVYAKYGYVPLFIGRVSKEKKYRELPSPEKAQV